MKLTSSNSSVLNNYLDKLLKIEKTLNYDVKRNQIINLITDLSEFNEENTERFEKILYYLLLMFLYYIITAKPKAHAFKNEMCFPLTKTKCELKKHPNSKFECFFNDFNRTKTSLFLPFPSKLIQDNLVCVLELQE